MRRIAEATSPTATYAEAERGILGFRWQHTSDNLWTLKVLIRM